SWSFGEPSPALFNAPRSAQRLRTRVHPSQVAGASLEHDADGQRPRPRAQPPLPQDEISRDRGAGLNHRDPGESPVLRGSSLFPARDSIRVESAKPGSFISRNLAGQSLVSIKFV